MMLQKILVSRQLSSTNKSHISGASIAAKKYPKNVM